MTAAQEGWEQTALTNNPTHLVLATILPGMHCGPISRVHQGPGLSTLSATFLRPQACVPGCTGRPGPRRALQAMNPHPTGSGVPSHLI